MRTLEETTSPITAADIRRRIRDWKSRIDKLYRQLGEWLPEGWSASKKNNVMMHEELMKKFKIPPVKLKSLELTGPDQEKATLEPRDLWIIGVNGRIDLMHKKRHYVIVDIADNFKKPDWRIAPLSSRNKLHKLDRKKFQSLFK